jgi:hypothetical protein
MPAADFTIRQGDHGQPLAATLTGTDGAAIDIAGATVRALVVPIGGGAAIVDAPASNDQVVDGSDGSKGRVSYTWQQADTATDGFFLGSWIVTFAGGAVETFPNGGYLLIEITADAPVDVGTLYLQPEELKASLEMTGLTYADEDIRRALRATCRALDKQCGRRFYPDPTPGEGDPFPVRFYDTGRHTRTVEIDDLFQLDAVALDLDGDGTYETQLTRGSDYALQPLNALADGRPFERIHFKRWLPLGGWALHGGNASIQVSGLFGWQTPPAQIIEATSIIAPKLVRRSREAPFGIVAAGGLDGMAVRLARTDPDVPGLLNGLDRGALIS